MNPIFLEIGNSTIKVARFGDAGEIDVTRYDRRETFDAWLEACDESLVIAPIGERLSGLVVPFARRHHDVRVIEFSDVAAFVGDGYDTPETLGLDRVLNLLGMEEDAVVISCGTAITVDARAAGRPVFGAILAGFRTAAEGLHERIPVLPLADLTTPPSLPARTSAGSVANGVLLGTARAAEGIARDLIASLFSTDAVPPVIITGGDAQLLRDLWSPSNPPPAIDDAVVFRGMRAAVGSA